MAFSFGLVEEFERSLVFSFSFDEVVPSVTDLALSFVLDLDGFFVLGSFLVLIGWVVGGCVDTVEML